MSGDHAPTRFRIEEKLDSCENGLRTILNTSISIFGDATSQFEEFSSKLENDIKNFWECQFEELEQKKHGLMKSIEEMGKEAMELEKALDLKDRKVMNFEINQDVPLVEIAETIWKILNSYKTIQKERLEEWNQLIKREGNLCIALGEQTVIPAMPVICGEAHKLIPNQDDIESAVQRINSLEAMEDKLKHDFALYKNKLASLLKELEYIPLTKVERFAMDLLENDSGNKTFPVNKHNLECLQETVVQYQSRKVDMEAEAECLRHNINALSKKLFQDKQEFLARNIGFSKSTIAALKNEYELLKEMRKKNLKELVIQHRSLLDDLWTRCCYSDNQRAAFRPYYVDYYSEEILNFHELEVEKLEDFYNKHKRVYQLAQSHKNLWDRLIHLEQEASDAARLFNNRGGKLLQEEKERKCIQKKLPAIQGELMALIIHYKATTGEDFLYFGAPLQEMLELKEEQRDAMKENIKMQRKVANNENLVLESRLGTRLISNKRKHQIPPNNNTTKVMKMAHCTTSSTASTASMKSTGSSTRSKKLVIPGTVSQIGVGAAAGSYMVTRTPVKTPAISTPENGTP